MEKHYMELARLISKMAINMRVISTMGCCMVFIIYDHLYPGKGKFTWASGVVYDGDFTYNKIEGEGKYFWPDGSTYIG